MSATWHQRRVDIIVLTIDHNKRQHREEAKDVIQDILRIKNVTQCADLFYLSLTNDATQSTVKCWSQKYSDLRL